MCRVLKVSTSAYYAWINHPKSNRAKENEELLKKIMTIHNESNRVYGSRKILRKLTKAGNAQSHSKTRPINHKRVERLMSVNGIKSKTKKKYKATTNSKHSLPVADNILNREFDSDVPNQKMVSDITYISTEEGWLYVAGILDLCGRKVVGLSMSGRMTKELVINALNDAYRTSGRPNNVILHSDRGSQYCSYAYQDKVKEYGFVCSMSRKGNCWDNAPMESFWGKLKQEGLNDQKFKTRDEAKAKVFEYIMVFYNRKRIHAGLDYRTPEEYYSEKSRMQKVA
jgi:putative transposase